MSSWHDFPLTGTPNTGGTIGGEHTVGYYDDGGVAKIVNCPTAVAPDAPAPENQADTFHYSTVIVQQPAAVFGSDGICTTAGYTPGGRYYAVGATADQPSDPPAVKTAKAAALALILSGAAELAKLS